MIAIPVLRADTLFRELATKVLFFLWKFFIRFQRLTWETYISKKMAGRGISGCEWAGNNYFVPFDFAQIRDCIVAEPLAPWTGSPASHRVSKSCQLRFLFSRFTIL